MTSCDFLDIVPKEVVMEEDIWNDIKNAEKVLAKLYNAIPSETMSDDVWGHQTKRHHWENNNQSSWKYNTGSWGPTDNPLETGIGAIKIYAGQTYLLNILSLYLYKETNKSIIK